MAIHLTVLPFGWNWYSVFQIGRLNTVKNPSSESTAGVDFYKVAAFWNGDFRLGLNRLFMHDALLNPDNTACEFFSICLSVRNENDGDVP